MKVDLCVIKGIYVNVVTDSAWRNIDNLAVHPDLFSFFAIPLMSPADGIRGHGALRKVPFLFDEAGIIVEIDDSKLAAYERDSAEGAAVTQAAIEEGDFGNRAFYEFLNMYCYCDVDDLIPRQTSDFRRQTTDIRPLPRVAGLIDQ